MRRAILVLLVGLLATSAEVFAQDDPKRCSKRNCTVNEVCRPDRNEEERQDGQQAYCISRAIRARRGEQTLPGFRLRELPLLFRKKGFTGIQRFAMDVPLRCPDGPTEGLCAGRVTIEVWVRGKWDKAGRAHYLIGGGRSQTERVIFGKGVSNIGRHVSAIRKDIRTRGAGRARLVFTSGTSKRIRRVRVPRIQDV